MEVYVKRMGDFYESAGASAVMLAHTLGLTLTWKREIPLAGIPAPSLEKYREEARRRGLILTEIKDNATHTPL